MSRGFLRFLSRLLFHPARIIVRPLEAFAPRQYMYLYERLLRLMGLNFKGTPRYVASSVKFDDFNLVTIGDRTVISAEVRLLTHDYSITTAAIAAGKTPETDISEKRPISIGRNAFIGLRCTLLPGSIVEQDVIVGAGSLVRGTLKARGVYLGNPAVWIMTIDEYYSRKLERGAQLFSD